MERFLSRHRKYIDGVLSGFDRVLFRGTLRSISYDKGMSMFLSCRHVLLKDFGVFVEQQSCELKEHAKAIAHSHGRPYEYIKSSSISKEQVAKDDFRDIKKTIFLLPKEQVKKFVTISFKMSEYDKYKLGSPERKKVIEENIKRMKDLIDDIKKANKK